MKISSNFTKSEQRLLSRLNTPQKIQDYLNSLPTNFEEKEETCLSPREVIKQKTAHCAEGAVFAAVALWYHGHRPLLLDLKTTPNDDEHVVALYKKDGYWGAISKTNHAVLRYREPIYSSVRELVLSYFHEYFKDNGHKTLRSYSKPFDLSKIKGHSWLTTQDGLWDIMTALDKSPHYLILNKSQIKNLRKADKIEIEAGKLIEYKAKKN